MVHFVYGQTGSGKTRLLLDKIVNHLISDSNTDKIIVCGFASRHAVNIIEESVFTLLEKRIKLDKTNKVKKLLLKYVSGDTNSFLISKHYNLKNKKKDFILPRVIITTHAYFNTRGDSFALYPFQVDLFWLKHVLQLNLELYVDEAHLLFDSLPWSFKTSGFYETVRTVGDTVYERPIFRKDLTKVDDLYWENVQERNTIHTYDYVSKVRNPKILEDVRNSTSKYTFPEIGKSKASVDYLDYKYHYIPNEKFSLENFKNIPLTLWMANYFWYALSAITGAIISGILVDKYTAHSIAVVTQLPMLFATLLLWFGNNFVTLIFFFIFFGIGSGMLQPMINSLLAERYGTKWIGEIKSLAMPLNVIASAASPIVMGLMIDAGSGLSELMALLICSSAYSTLVAYFVFNIRGVKDPFMDQKFREQW